MTTPQHHSEDPNVAAGAAVAEPLKSALEALEIALSRPLVPGEHAAWTEAVTQSWEVAEQRIGEQRAMHERQYQQMLESDPEIFTRVELLRQEDRELQAERDSLRELIERLKRKTPVAEPNEARTDAERQAVVDRGIALVVRHRRQEVAIDTWFGEAFNRDRGLVD